MYLDVFVRRGEAESIRKNFARGACSCIWAFIVLHNALKLRCLAVEYFDQYFAESGLSGVVQRNWAGIEAHRLKDMPAARKLFEELLKKQVHFF